MRDLKKGPSRSLKIIGCGEGRGGYMLAPLLSQFRLPCKMTVNFKKVNKESSKERKNYFSKRIGRKWRLK